VSRRNFVWTICWSPGPLWERIVCRLMGYHTFSPPMWQHHFKAFLITSFLLGVGLWLTIFGWSYVQTDQRLKQSSAVVEGRVVSSSTYKLSRGGQSSALVVKYTPPNHPTITKKFDVSSGDYQTAQATGKAKVTYFPEDPQVSRVTEFEILPFQVLIGLGGLMIMAGLFCLLHALKPTGKTSAPSN
jgi:hypothetical protein